jgi:hypothetical protein
MNSRANNSTVFVIALILASHFAPAECVTVNSATAIKFVRSSSNLRLTIRRDGQPAPGAMVTFSGYGNTVPNAFSVAADENGVVVFKDLPLGKYSVNALDQNGGGGNLYVDVFPGRDSKVTSLVVALEQGYRPTTPIEVANVRSFSGVVVDPSGAQIPAVIFVLKQGTPEKLIDSLSTRDGSFAAYLPPGRYAAYFVASGFKSKILRFTVSEQGAERLSVSLMIGSC